MAILLSVHRTFLKHREENPLSTLSERAIRQGVKSGELPYIKAGYKILVCYETFDNWIRGFMPGEINSGVPPDIEGTKVGR